MGRRCVRAGDAALPGPRDRWHSDAAVTRPYRAATGRRIFASPPPARAGPRPFPPRPEPAMNARFLAPNERAFVARRRLTS
jgi:hypothetical protein